MLISSPYVVIDWICTEETCGHYRMEFETQAAHASGEILEITQRGLYDGRQTKRQGYHIKSRRRRPYQMLQTWLLGIALILAPPPPRITKTGDGGRGGWEIVSIDFETATEWLGRFARSYENESVDFHRSAVRPGRTLQGVLGLTYRDKIRAVLHFNEASIGVANITSVAADRGDFDVAAPLATVIR